MRDSKIDQKQPVVKEIAALLDGASSAVVVDYRGLTVEQDTQLRKQLREAGVVYKVYKNTMVRIAAKGTDFEKFDAYLEGPTALAVSKDDATVAARVLAKFAKTAPKLEIKGGIVEGAAYDAREWLQSQRFRRERSCSADSSASCRARSRTLHASSSRLQSRTLHRLRSKPQVPEALSNIYSTI